MRGSESKQASMLCLLSPEDRVPQNHPLRAIKRLAEAALEEISPLLDAMYSENGRPSIPPEQLLKSQLLIALYTVRSERLFCEQLDYNLLFRWFLNMSMVEESFDHSTFSLNRARLIEHDVARQFFASVVTQARGARLLSGEHFTVDGTLIDAWASQKSFQPKGSKKKGPPDDPGNPTVNFHGEKRSNETHESTTDPEAKLARKGDGQPARLSYAQHALMDNRYGLLVDLRISEANGIRGTSSRPRDARPGDRKGPAPHRRRRQSLRSAQLRRRLPCPRYHAARRAEPQGLRRLRCRWAHDCTARLHREPTAAQARRRDLWLDQDGRELQAHQVPRPGPH